MENTRIPRHNLTQHKPLELSDLNNDVLFEMFLQFVATDWDGGPFILMEVCTGWRDLVLSRPRLWTWILVDDSQTDWKERIEVAAYLSKALPVQIYLRLPFTSEIPISHIVRRCENLCIDSGWTPIDDYYDTFPRRWKPEVIPKYSGTKDRFMNISEDVMRFLADVPADRINIFSVDLDRTCFAYSAWEIYSQLIDGKSIKNLLESVHPFLLVALVFTHSDNGFSRGVQIEIGEIWTLLPNLPHLNHLELQDTFVKIGRMTTLPHICLQSLRTINIDSSMSHSVFFSFVDDIQFGLLSILDSLDAPVIESMTLHGSIQRIKAAMIKASTRPSYLTLTISMFDEGVDEPKFNQDWVWRGLKQATICLPETEKAFSHLKMPEGLAPTIFSLMTLLPKGASKRFRGGGELDAIMRSDIHNSGKSDLFYTHSRPLGYSFEAEGIASLALWCSVDERHGSPPPYARWLKSVAHLSIADSGSLDSCLDVYLSHVFEPVLRSWDSHAMYISKGDSIGRGTFSYLTTLRCVELLADNIVRNFDTPSLHTITLVEDVDDNDPFGVLPQTLLKYASRLKQLTTLGIEFIPVWDRLFDLVSKFQAPDQAICTINLPGLPHPSILQLLVDALQGGSLDYPIWDQLFDSYGSERVPGMGSCFECFMSGFFLL